VVAPSRDAPRVEARKRLCVAATLALAGPLAITGCGGSSKPSYCSDRSDLQSSVKGLGDVKVTQSGGLDQLKSQLQQVESNANKVVSSAKGDFPSETSAISSSVSSLKSAVQGLPSSPSAQQLAQVAGDTKAVVTSVDGFTKATDSKCS
jgi:hypothetical protein